MTTTMGKETQAQSWDALIYSSGDFWLIPIEVVSQGLIWIASCEWAVANILREKVPSRNGGGGDVFPQSSWKDLSFAGQSRWRLSREPICAFKQIQVCVSLSPLHTYIPSPPLATVSFHWASYFCVFTQSNFEEWISLNNKNIMGCFQELLSADVKGQVFFVSSAAPFQTNKCH